MVEFRRSLIIKEKGETIARSMVHFTADINHQQPKAQDKCIICCQKHDVDNCKEYMKKSIEKKANSSLEKIMLWLL